MTAQRPTNREFREFRETSRAVRGIRGSVARAAVLAIVAALALLVPLAAAQQPHEVPPDFQNAQENGFGSIAMEPYLDAGADEVNVEARIVLRDLATLQRASNVLVAVNLHDGSVKVDPAPVQAGGRDLQPVRTETINGGLQLQRFYNPADLVAAAQGKTVELSVRAGAEATANGQWHVGVLVIAFDAGWGTLRAVDGGGAELYGFTVLMASGIPSSPLAPFSGHGNTAAVIPLFALALAGTAGGVWALAFVVQERRASRGAPAPPTPLPARPAAPAAVPVAAAAAASPVAKPKPAPTPLPQSPPPARAPAFEVDRSWSRRTVAKPSAAAQGSSAVPALASASVPVVSAALAAAAAPPAAPAAAPAPADVPVFGSPESPVKPLVQGPKMPPGFSPPPWPAATAAFAEAAAAEGVDVALTAAEPRPAPASPALAAAAVPSAAPSSPPSPSPGPPAAPALLPMPASTAPPFAPPLEPLPAPAQEGPGQKPPLRAPRRGRRPTPGAHGDAPLPSPARPRAAHAPAQRTHGRRRGQPSR